VLQSSAKVGNGSEESVKRGIRQIPCELGGEGKTFLIGVVKKWLKFRERGRNKVKRTEGNTGRATKWNYGERKLGARNYAAARVKRALPRERRD